MSKFHLENLYSSTSYKHTETDLYSSKVSVNCRQVKYKYTANSSFHYIPWLLYEDIWNTALLHRSWRATWHLSNKASKRFVQEWASPKHTWQKFLQYTVSTKLATLNIKPTSYATGISHLCTNALYSDVHIIFANSQKQTHPTKQLWLYITVTTLSLRSEWVCIEGGGEVRRGKNWTSLAKLVVHTIDLHAQAVGISQGRGFLHQLPTQSFTPASFVSGAISICNCSFAHLWPRGTFL